MPVSLQSSQGNECGPECPCVHLQGFSGHRFVRGIYQQVMRQVMVSRAVLGFVITLKVR